MIPIFTWVLNSLSYSIASPLPCAASATGNGDLIPYPPRGILTGWRTDAFQLPCLEVFDSFLNRLVVLVPNKYMAMPAACSALKRFDPKSPLMIELT